MSNGEAIGCIIGAVLGLLICLVIHYWNKAKQYEALDNLENFLREIPEDSK